MTITPEIQTALIGLATLIITSFFGYLSMKLEKVHKIVNSQRTQMEQDIADLKNEILRLQDGGDNTPDGSASVHLEYGEVRTSKSLPVT